MSSKQKVESILNYYEDRFNILLKYGNFIGDAYHNDFIQQCDNCQDPCWITYNHYKLVCPDCHNKIQNINKQYENLTLLKEEYEYNEHCK